jgi:hypothetical protein
MAFVPVAIGVSSFAAGYVTSRYMTAPEDLVEEPLTKYETGKKTECEKKKLPLSMADELKQFDKGKLTKVDADSIKPYRTPSLVEVIREQLAIRRLSISK